MIKYIETTNSQLIESERNLKVFDEVDILVIGGGPAGIGAAVAAARSGCKTLLLEEAICLGGLFTIGLVCIPIGSVSGVGRELLDRLEAVDAHAHRNTDPEKTKVVLDRLLIGSGADLLFMARAVEAIVEDSVIRGVVIESKSGRQAILAKRVIDASGDGDVAYFAGAPWESGRKIDGLNQSVSMEFRVANVDFDKYNEWKKEKQRSGWKSSLHRAVDNGDLPYLIENHLNWMTRTPGRPEGEGRDEVSICLAHSRHPHTLDVRDLTRMAIEGREQVDLLVKFLKKYIPGFENCWLVDTGLLLGVRDSRRVMGEYVLTAEDLAKHRKFDDAIAKSGHGYDIHDPVKPGVMKWVKMTVDGKTRNVVCNKGGLSSSSMPLDNENLVTYDGEDASSAKGGFYTIPYRCLIPLRIENLLVAGRCLSATFEAQSGARLIMTCMDMGQAAGTAAALSLQQNSSPRELDVESLQRELIKQGVDIGKE